MVVSPLSDAPSQVKPGDLLSLQITGLTPQGDGIGHTAGPGVGQVVFVPQGIPGDQVEVRVIETRRNYLIGRIQSIQVPSPERVRPACIVADKCGGCQWQHVSYAMQLATKQQILADALQRIGGIPLPEPVPILGSPQPLRYRNKVTYPIAQPEGQPLRMGYYQTGSHRLVNLNQCPVQDERLDVFLREIKRDLQETGWSVYEETRHQGHLRHLGLRIGRRTREVLLTLVSRSRRLPQLETWAQRWLDRYPDLVGVCLNLNPARTNTIFGPQTEVIAGRGALREEFAGLSLWIDSTSFFQVNTEQAEAFFTWIADQLQLQGHETLLDAYCGIGTFTLLLAQRAKRVVGVESLPEAVLQARYNAQFNGITSVQFFQGTVEQVLPTLPPADIVVLDPPRRGCDRQVLETLLLRQPQRLVYISCHPATLARDLQVLLAEGSYRLTQWRAADFFPQTGHVEGVAFLERG
ncbi:23S rRNA (uracil(1939)-C(5))-methyltransferase RlmD [Thermostichus vulcanus]|uniref:23S rRNA (Uracil(1939)-C(5))-methyltransferase RlmD n=1 Tax=Thermostichus vulcanus str. 'Rupite' TaxID=2813851 RepID=A0ABT0CA70_THEVL|nr:23S rRNA (uracil(1939)-C(5))-methyltransferase RlmD [Thermostichus vulcanus]MCJ2542651.1 23S rRNA (uracil(1939)-C(5))-methyltransferase RlmD [Thermostichus vulcanus str. 'Rupite']